MTRATEYAARLDELAAEIVRQDRKMWDAGKLTRPPIREQLTGMVRAYAIMAGIKDLREAREEAMGIGALIVGDET